MSLILTAALFLTLLANSGLSTRNHINTILVPSFYKAGLTAKSGKHHLQMHKERREHESCHENASATSLYLATGESLHPALDYPTKPAHDAHTPHVR